MFDKEIPIRLYEYDGIFLKDAVITLDVRFGPPDLPEFVIYEDRAYKLCSDQPKPGSGSPIEYKEIFTRKVTSAAPKSKPPRQPIEAEPMKRT